MLEGPQKRDQPPENFGIKFRVLLHVYHENQPCELADRSERLRIGPSGSTLRIAVFP